jgi:hypothetical protein
MIEVKKESLLTIIEELIIQQNRAYSAISMAITFCEATGQSRILIIGVDKPFLLELYSHVEKMSQMAWPLGVPAIAMELQARALTASVQSCQDRIRSIETLTGMRQSIHPHERNDAGARDQDWKSLDLVDITRDLSSLLSRSAFIRMQADTGAYLLRQMARTLEAWPGRSVEVHSQDMSGHQYDLLSKLRHIESWLLGLDARCRYLSERTAAQSQTVRHEKFRNFKAVAHLLLGLLSYLVQGYIYRHRYCQIIAEDRGTKPLYCRAQPPRQ